MTRIEFTDVSGTTPIDVYVADFRGENRTYLGQITGVTTNPVPPTVYEYPPTLFDGASSVMVILSGSDGCEMFKIIDC